VELKVSENETLMMSDNLVHSVDLSEFYEKTIYSDYSFLIKFLDAELVFPVTEIEYSSLDKEYVFHLVNSKNNINSLLKSKDFTEVAVKNGDDNIILLSDKDVKSFSYTASLVGNTAPIKLTLSLVSDI
jgi:hypothetical protein